MCLLTQILTQIPSVHACGGMSVCPPQVMHQSVSELKKRPEEGCYIHGLFLEGARWDPEAFQLAESRPKELYTEMAVIWLLPTPSRKIQNQDFYMCPIYKTLTRAGTGPGQGSLHHRWGPRIGTQRPVSTPDSDRSRAELDHQQAGGCPELGLSLWEVAPELAILSPPSADPPGSWEPPPAN